MWIVWILSLAEIGKNVWIFHEIDVIASTLRDFLDWAKFFYTNESNCRR